MNSLTLARLLIVVLSLSLMVVSIPLLGWFLGCPALAAVFMVGGIAYVMVEDLGGAA
jgi:uncharacterized ion transporter superfamily protein YfcC